MIKSVACLIQHFRLARLIKGMYITDLSYHNIHNKVHPMDFAVGSLISATYKVSKWS